MNPLDIRIEELMQITACTNPSVPEWYRRLCVEKYIRDEEPELLVYTPTDNVLPVEGDGINVIKIPNNIEETPTIKVENETD